MKANNPWIGASFYEEPLNKKEGTPKFCGREKETNELFQMVYNNIYVTLYGKSGLGKTSLLKAGLFPRLRNACFFPVYLRFNNKSVENISRYLVETIERTLKEEHGQVIEVPVIEEKPDTSETRFLWSYFAQHSFLNNEGKTVFPVIVLDQFEEFFRYNKEQTEILLRQIDYLAEGNHELPDQTLPNGQKYEYCYNFRFVGSIREDELYRLEDCIDNNFLNCMKQNRVRLRGLSESGAAEAIWIPGHDCIKQQDFQKVTSDIIAAAPNGDGTVNTLLLSIICTNLYEQLGNDQLIDSEMTRNLNYPIESFYREQISKLPRRERLFVEQEMTNGPQRKPVSLTEFKKRAPRALKLAPALFHQFPLPGTDKMHVELMHDRLAEVVYNIKKQEGESKGVKTIRGYIIFFIVFIACYALYQGQTTDDKYKVTSAYTEIRDHRYSTTDTLWIASEVLRDNGAVEELAIEDKKQYNIINCPYLTTIDLSNIRTDSFNLELEDLPMLRTITMPKVMPYLKLKANKCPRLMLTIHSGMGHLEIDCEKLSVHIEQDAKRFVWNDRILWDIEERNIVFYDSEAHPNNTIRCFFPLGILERSIQFKGKTFQNLQPEKNIDNRSWSAQHFSRNATTINNEHLSPDIKEITFPDSVNSIPNKICYQFHRLDTVKMPRKAVVIFESAFEGCDRLRSITLPDNLEEIGKHAFKGCKQLRSIIIPASVKNIGEEAFAGCDSLRSITILGNPNLGARVFAFNQELSHVEWNANGTMEFIYFFNPFFDCPKVDLQSLKINIMERPECRTTAEGVTFSRDGFIYAREYPAELHFPLFAGAYDWTFIGDTSPLTDIYVPFAHPEPSSAITNTKRAFYIYLPDAQKGHINLHVPYGCSRYYAANPHFSRFMQIDEFSQWQTRWIFIKSRLEDLRLNFNHYWYIHVPVFMLFVIIGLVCMHFKRKENKWTALLPGALLFAVLTVFASVAFFWTELYMDGYSHNISGAIGGIMGLSIVTFSFFAPEIWQWERKRKEKAEITKEKRRIMRERRKRRIRTRLRICFHQIMHHKAILVILICGVAIAFFSVKHYQHSHDLRLALQEGNYERALQLRANQLFANDSLTSDEETELRELIIRSGVDPQFHHVQVLTGYSTQYASSLKDHYCIRKGDSIILWTDGGKRYDFVSRKYHLESYHSFRIHYEEKMISIYDQTTDSTAIYSLSSGSDMPLTIIAGRLQDEYFEQNLFFSEHEGKIFLNDLEGHSISVPNESFNSTSLSWGAIMRNGTVYTHCGDSLVFHKFGKGELRGIIGNRFLLWEDKDTGEKHFYDISNGFAVRNDLDMWTDKYQYSNDYFLRTSPHEKLSHHVKSNDLKRSWMLSGNIKWQGRHIIVYEKGHKWFAFDTRNFTEQEISKQASDLSRLYGYSIRTFNNRYLIIGNTAYERAYAFDTEDNCRLIGQLDGQWFEDYEFSNRLSFQFTQHTWLEKGDSIQFYRFIDNHLKRGTCLPLQIAKEKAWTEGFIIATKDNMTNIYSMDDNLSQPIVLHNKLTTGTFLSGRTLLIPVSNDLHVYEYDGLKELIERSSLSRSYKNRLLQRIH